MLKNDIRYILRRVIVALLIAFCFFFLKTNKILAAELTSSSGYRVSYSSGTANSSNTTCSYSGTILNSGLINAGTGWSNTNSGTCLYIRNVGINIQTPSDTSKQFEPGIQYTLKVLWNFNPRPNTLAWSGGVTPQVFNGSSYVDSSLVQVTSWSGVVASDNYGIYITINFTVTTRQRYINFVMTPINTAVNPNFQLFRYYQQGINIKDFTLTEDDNATVNAIENQTTIIQQGFQDLKVIITGLQQDEYDYLTDDGDPSIDVSGMSGITGILPPGPLDTLLSLPISILNLFIDNTTGTCTPLTIDFVFDSEITYPCFGTSFYNNLDTISNLYINLVPSVILLLFYLKFTYKRVERAVSFESTVDDEWGGV